MTTAIAAINTNRNYICIEKDEDIFKVGQKRVYERQMNSYNRCANPQYIYTFLFSPRILSLNEFQPSS